jgi:hypothetical protein
MSASVAVAGHPSIGSYIAESLFDRERRVPGALLAGVSQRMDPDGAE